MGLPFSISGLISPLFTCQHNFCCECINKIFILSPRLVFFTDGADRTPTFFFQESDFCSSLLAAFVKRTIKLKSWLTHCNHNLRFDGLIVRLIYTEIITIMAGLYKVFLSKNNSTLYMIGIIWKTVYSLQKIMKIIKKFMRYIELGKFVETPDF